MGDMLRIVEGEIVSYVYGNRDDLYFIKLEILHIFREKESESLNLYIHAFDSEICFHSGLITYLEDSLREHDMPFTKEALPSLPIVEIDPDILSHGPEPITLRDYQCLGVKKALSAYRGIFNVATGGGKTEVIIGIALMMEEVSDKKHTSLTIVPSTSSLKQIYKRFRNRGIKSVGRLGGSYKEWDKEHIVATASMVASRIKSEDFQMAKLLRNVYLLMFDEVHHLGTAASWQSIALNCQAPRRYGFSGSPWASGLPFTDLLDEEESKHADFQVASHVGQTLLYLSSKLLRDMGVIVDPKIYVLPVSQPDLSRKKFPQWRWVYKNGIIQHDQRNELVINSICELHKRGHRVATLVVSIAHGNELLKKLHQKGISAAFTKGSDEVYTYDGKKICKHKDAGERYRDDFLEGKIDTLIGSVIIDEAMDLPGMSALILAGAMKSPIRAVQRIGRAIRTAEGKEEAIIVDFRDRQHYFLNSHTNKRLRIYDAHEYDYEELSYEEFIKRLS